MFRKPRDDNTNADVGRPPSPGHGPAKTPFSLAIPPNIPPPTRMAVAKSKASSKAVPLPTIGRQGLIGSAKKSTTANKLRDKGNGSIMNFFKKEDTGLFLSEGSPAVSTYEEEADFDRFNEHDVPSKRRRVSTEPDDHPPATETPPPVPRQLSASTKSGPFMEESDAEQDDLPEELDVVVKQEPVDIDTNDSGIELGRTEVNEMAAVPPLLKQETSYIPDLDQFQDFEGMDGDFDEDIYEEGDEFIEKRYMEEQARIEQMEAENGGQSLCPICSESLAAVSEQDAAVHVNNCLDGNPTPLPKPVTVKAEVEDEKPDAKVLDPRQFKPNRAPKPGQESPFTLSNPSANGASVFNKLMSGHAESRAWAEAAAAEHASRGKPAYQRTCPFYKIMDGLFICVDAFRYGAVKGCQAYFLSHFHSDHYVGLTSSWNHGPIYCSHVTANLVRQQLKVDPKYVVDLEFEQTVEVPRTKGVQVTMISANHCPGSSLYLFEKTIGKRTNGQPRMQRVLHCGDFRACRMHVTHPLLMPETRDKISGKMSEQKIDVCYLDTTYLNPKYAFPSQENVIKACADMCVSLSKITPDASDGWEQMKRQRAGEGMVKFVRRESSGISIKEEDQNTDMKVEAAPNASQQILSSASSKMNRGRLLVIVGTYSIGKERICLGIAKALNSKIYAPPSKQRIVAALEDPELDALMTNDPRAAQVHMTPLFEIRADTLDDYLKDYFPHFTRAVGFRPSGWNYRPPNSRFTDSPTVQTVLHSDNWKSTYSMRELVPQRGSTSRASCFGVPYSEHSSFRELTMFCCALRIEKIIPTVNVGSAKSRDRMKSWIERWQAERRKNGLYALPEDGSW